MLRIVMVICFLFSGLVMAQVESLIQFHGQNAETITLNKTVSVTRSKPVEVPSTCTREVPYESYECQDVTRYREACSWIPEAQSCHNEDERVCRSVTRTREECTNGPNRQVCTDIPVRQVCTERPTRQVCSPVSRTRQECSTGPSRQVCTPRPSREVCNERPSREVCRTRADGTQSCQTVGGGQSCTTVGGGESCRTEEGSRTCRDVSYTEQSCTTVGGGQSCQTVGGGQSCHQEAGPRTCQNVNYPDQECSTVTHRRCETVPRHEECRDVPYSENVCGNVTRYNSESYACMRTEQQSVVMQKQLTGTVNVSFLTHGLVEEFPLSVLVSPVSADHKAFVAKSTLKKEPKVLVVVNKSQVNVASETDSEINLTGDVTIEVLEPQMMNLNFPTGFSSVVMDKDSQILTLTMEGGISAQGTVELQLFRKPLIGKPQTIVDFKSEYPSKRVKIVADKLIVDLSDRVDGKLKKLSMKLKLIAPFALKGELLNAKKPVTEQEYEKMGVDL